MHRNEVFGLFIMNFDPVALEGIATGSGGSSLSRERVYDLRYLRGLTARDKRPLVGSTLSLGRDAKADYPVGARKDVGKEARCHQQCRGQRFVGLPRAQRAARRDAVDALLGGEVANPDNGSMVEGYAQVGGGVVRCGHAEQVVCRLVWRHLSRQPMRSVSLRMLQSQAQYAMQETKGCTCCCWTNQEARTYSVRLSSFTGTTGRHVATSVDATADANT
jgi:hypothetical protein